MNYGSKLLTISGILILVVLLFNPYTVNALNENEASLLLDQAEETLSSTFEAVKSAETKGADISGFTDHLNDATELLARAQNSFKVGDYSRTENFANLAIELGDQIKTTALSLGDFKSDLPEQEMWNTVFGSAIAFSIVVVGSLVCWIFFKRYYYMRKSILKPEVMSAES